VAHLKSYPARGLGASLLVVDDVAGLAHALVMPEVFRWIRERTEEMPVLMGTSAAGWETSPGTRWRPGSRPSSPP
jgi:hypothetical protein